MMGWQGASRVFAAVLVVVTVWVGTAAAAETWTLVGWNNLGMHCMDADYSVLSLLPPYNTIHAQLIDPYGRLVTNPAAQGITVTYQGEADPDGSINTTSGNSTAGPKTNFWDYVLPTYGAALLVDQGLAGKPMPGAGNGPKLMNFDATARWFIAEGIPITPYDDRGVKNYYPLMRLVARRSDGTVLATTDIVLPVSDEMTCKACHGSNTVLRAKPAGGWVNELGSVERDFRLNILRLHDEHQAADPAFADALDHFGFEPTGLEATARAGTPILCAKCHRSEALPGSGYGTIPPLTQAIHYRHKKLDEIDSGRGACYRCHPGSVTRCLRGAMGAAVAPDGTLAMQCQNCHGSMVQVASPDRTGWLEEPSCQNCHTGTAVTNSGQIRFTSVFDATGALRVPADRTFATNADTPLPGLDLYRFSTGHGGVKCEGCHGSTHAEFPSSHRNDNLGSIDHQGHVGMLAECVSCHGQSPETFDGGPHGMHPVGSAWIDHHGDGAKTIGRDRCQACHGTDYRGTVLSRAKADRLLSTELGTKYFWRGFQVGCYDCHQGPFNTSLNANRPPLAQGATASTPQDTAVAIALSASDPDGSPVTLRIVSQPARGTVGLSGTTATYYPETGFTGSEVFTFAARDGSTDSNLATVTVSVSPAVPTGTATPTPTWTPTLPPTFTPTRTPTPTFTPTRTPTKTLTPTPTRRRRG